MSKRNNSGLEVTQKEKGIYVTNIKTINLSNKVKKLTLIDFFKVYLLYHKTITPEELFNDQPFRGDRRRLITK